MKTNVAVFFGGRSVEHEVSIISAVQAMHALDPEKYEVIPVYLTKRGELLYGAALSDIETFRRGPLERLSEELVHAVAAREGDEVWLYERRSGLRGRKPLCRVDIALPIVHGTNCEDGTVQGFLELLGVPYVGCDVMASAIGMDKALCKSALKDAGVPVLDCMSFRMREWTRGRDALLARIEERFGYPVIVKPANLGSSVGIGKAGSRDELIDAVELAGSFAPKLLVERAVTHLREINCSVLGDADECRASVCEEPIMSDEILSYQDKYIAGASDKNGSKGMSSLKRRLPADLPEAKSAEIAELSCRAFKALGCCGVVRIDFLLDTQEDRVYVNELNTIPGSLAFYLWEAAGVPYSALLDELIALGFKRARDRQNLTFTYDTNILDGAGALGVKSAKGAKR